MGENILNNSRNLLKRLLHLYPIDILKERFSKKGGFNNILDDIITGNSLGALRKFCYESQVYTKQHIYLLTLNKPFRKSELTHAFPLEVVLEEEVSGEYRYFCLPKVTYTVYLSNPIDKDEISFLQPIVVTVTGKSLIVRCTKLNKNIGSYFTEEREARQIKEANGTKESVAQIIEYFGYYFTISPNDLNKGIKALWGNDTLDCHKIQYRDKFSMNNSVMDGSDTFKQKYPNEYKEIIKRPLNSALWRYLLNDTSLCETFLCDVTAGEITINSYPKLANQVTNVITKILTNN